MNEEEIINEEHYEKEIETEWDEWKQTDDSRRFREWQSDNKTVF